MKDQINLAKWMAQAGHMTQMYGDLPYMYHIEQVVQEAKDLGMPDDVIIACYLHDIIEDTTYSYKTIEKSFGTQVAEIVYSVTDELGRNRKERKEKTLPKTAENAKGILVKMCDRIANMRHSARFSPEKYSMYALECEHFITTLESSTGYEKICSDTLLKISYDQCILILTAFD